MRTIGRAMMRGVAAAAAGVLFLSAPAAAARAAETAAPAAQCVLAPGVYGITNSDGELVGLLIVYPDCRIEVYRRPPSGSL